MKTSEIIWIALAALAAIVILPKLLAGSTAAAPSAPATSSTGTDLGSLASGLGSDLDNILGDI